MDCETAIKKLLNSYNEDNKNYIIKSINLIIKDNNIDNIKLVKMNDINNKFFKSNKSKKSSNSNKTLCTICQEDIKFKEHKFVFGKCNHIFHKKCMNKYMKTKKLDLCCPNCNKSYQNELFNLL